MNDCSPVRQALIWAVALAVSAAIGSGLSSRDWLDALLYAVVLAPMTFLLMWALLDHKQKR